jgi:hypothetical protein
MQHHRAAAAAQYRFRCEMACFVHQMFGVASDVHACVETFGTANGCAQAETGLV